MCVCVCVCACAHVCMHTPAYLIVHWEYYCDNCYVLVKFVTWNIIPGDLGYISCESPPESGESSQYRAPAALCWKSFVDLRRGVSSPWRKLEKWWI